MDKEHADYVLSLKYDLAEKDKLLAECREFILNNVGVRDEFIDYAGKHELLDKLPKGD